MATHSTRPFSVSVAKIKRHRSLQKKIRSRFSTKERSHRIIHVNLGLPSYTNPSVSDFISSIPIHQSGRSKRKVTPIIDNPTGFAETRASLTTISRVHRECSSVIQVKSFHDNSLGKDVQQKHSSHSVPNLKNVEVKDTWANPMDYTNKRDQKRNRKKQKKCILSTIVIAILLAIAIMIILIVFLIKSRTSTSTFNMTSPTLRWRLSGVTVAGISGLNGTNSTQLDNPWGLALTYDLTLYVADRYNNRVQKFLRGSSLGKTVAGQENGTTNGSSSTILNRPANIYLNSNENLYIADGYSHRVQFWAKDATSGTTVAGSGISGNTSEQLHYPYGVSRDPNSDTLYVADQYNHRIMGYRSGNTSGFVVAADNGPGLNNTQLNFPISVYFDSLSKSLLISNFANNQIVRWVVGQNHWDIVAGSITGETGNSSILLNGPIGLTLDPMGNLYVADLFNHRIQLFLNDELNATTIAGSNGQLGDNDTLLNLPYAVALDNQLNFYVADNQNHRVQQFLRY